MVEEKIVMLWLPKRFDGKWHWLIKVKRTEVIHSGYVDGKLVGIKIVKYELLNGE